jgi:hypothetical protein
MVNVASELPKAAISPPLATRVATASDKGTMRTSRSRRVITATARERLPPNRSWSFSRIGHVVTTIVVAQRAATRKGTRIQNVATMSVPMKSTASVARVTSIDFLP